MASWSRIRLVWATSFVGKPQLRQAGAAGAASVLASMGVYVFSYEVLREVLCEASRRTSTRDFGRDILPAMAGRYRMLAWPFVDAMGETPGYWWREVGTIDAYWAAQRRQRLGKHSWGVVAKAVAAALLPYLASYIPKMGPYLSSPFSLPLWLPLSMGLGMLGWQIRPAVLSIFRKIDNPSAETLQDLIQGPFCPQCHKRLQPGAQVDTEVADAPRNIVAGHCQHCHWSHPELGLDPDALRGITLHKVKSLVYREAQRQARARKFPQHGHNVRGPRLRFKGWQDGLMRWLGSQ